jgi:glucose/arabinose dehydrogenase
MSRRATAASLGAILAASLFTGIAVLRADEAAPAGSAACTGDNAGLTLPKGFCATIFADDLGSTRHIVVADDGTLYANTSGRAGFFSGGALIALKDKDGDGKADVNVHFGESVGGTGIALYKDWLYAESHGQILRYVRHAGDVAPQGKPEAVVTDLPLNGDHTMHPFSIDEKGNHFVDLGSATNSCQEKNRAKESPGINPCKESETRGGIWRYDANKTGQVFSPKERYATGLRNAEGIDFDAEGHVFATQHGRDQLFQNWPKLYNSEQGSELPAEELVLLRDGGDYGWPYCYYDGEQGKLVLAPEYGGDGGKAVGVCAEKIPPIAAFPAHWAPNDLKIYKGKQFPEAYRGGAFIAFHGSWNRTAGPQGGYNVVFQPLADGKASGKYSIFAEGFRTEGGTVHRPTGLAVGPDGAVYVSDDNAGRIYRIFYKG